MQGFRDQIARQYDALVTQTQLEPTIEEPSASLWLSSSTEDFLMPVHQELSNAGNWLELGEYTEETLLSTKGLFFNIRSSLFLLNQKLNSDENKEKSSTTPPHPTQENSQSGTRLFTSAQTTPITTTTHSRQSISSTTESGLYSSFVCFSLLMRQKSYMFIFYL